MQITSPSAVMVDEATNQVRVTLRGQMLLAGDLVFSLRLDPRLKKLSSNAGVSTSATQLGLSASSSLEQSFDAYLPDDGHFGFYVGYTFRPGSPLEEGPPVVNSSRAAIYVTIEDGEISRVELSPDPKHTSTELGGPVVPSGASRTSRASGASGASGESDPVPISVSISGRIVYRITRPAFTNEESSTADRTSTHPVYPIKVFTDWDPSTTDRINTPKSVWNSTPGFTQPSCRSVV